MVRGAPGCSADLLPLAQGIRRLEDGPGETDEIAGERKQEAETAGGGAGAGQTRLASAVLERCFLQRMCL